MLPWGSGHELGTKQPPQVDLFGDLFFLLLKMKTIETGCIKMGDSKISHTVEAQRVKFPNKSFVHMHECK